MGTEEFGSKHEYNYSIDSISYKLNTQELILAEGNWINHMLKN